MAAAHLGPIAEIDRDADRAVAVVLDGIGLALAHRDGETVGLGDFASQPLAPPRFACASTCSAMSWSSAASKVKPWRFGMGAL